MLADLGWILLGIVCLWAGAEGLVGGAANLALRFRIAPRVVGLTVVGFGTSLPELLVSVRAAFAAPPAPDLAVGNAVGSNIANICLILALAALIRPMLVAPVTLRRDLPVALGFGLLLLAFLVFDGTGGRVIARWEGALLLAGLVAFVGWSIRTGRLADDDEVPPLRPRAIGVDVVLLLAGLGFLMVGADRLVLGATSIARALEISERVIGVTVVAVGTSLPELATTVVAAARGQSEIGLGNVLGSNVFNVGGIVGITALCTPLPVAPGFLRLDIPLMLGATLVLFPYLRSGWRLSRREGAVLLAVYVGYTVWLFAS